MKFKYVEHRFKPETMDIIMRATTIIDEYTGQGFDLTLRQIYYQFIARDAFPDSWIDAKINSKNVEKNYKRLGSIINDARLAGLIDWNSLVDRTRLHSQVSMWDSPDQIVRICANQFKRDPWEDQETYIEVWIEKEALVGIIEDVCNRYRVPYIACRGYMSQSAQYRSARRIDFAESRGKETYVLHLGDHDPSGLDMTRDNDDRLSLLGGPATVKRLALNMDQVEEHDPPPSPAKVSDSRFETYVSRFGQDCWELDALEPAMISELIEGNITDLIDQGAWDQSMEEEKNQKSDIKAISDNWDAVVEHARNINGEG